MQYHDIQVNIPESRVSLTATEVDTEPSLSHSSTGVLESSAIKPQKCLHLRDSVHNVYDIEELIHERELQEEEGGAAVAAAVAAPGTPKRKLIQLVKL